MNIIDFELDVDPTGTSLKGYVSASYGALVEAFGKPNYTDDTGLDKVTTEWDIDFRIQDEDDPEDFRTVTATIYDWKEGNAYRCRNGQAYNWHIGGDSYDAVECVEQALKEGVLA